MRDDSFYGRPSVLVAPGIDQIFIIIWVEQSGTAANYLILFDSLHNNWPWLPYQVTMVTLAGYSPLPQCYPSASLLNLTARPNRYN